MSSIHSAWYICHEVATLVCCTCCYTQHILEMFPAIEYRMNGLLFSAIGGCCYCDDGGAVHTWVP